MNVCLYKGANTCGCRGLGVYMFFMNVCVRVLLYVQSVGFNKGSCEGF